MALIVTSKPCGYELGADVSFVPGSGYYVDVDGPTSVATANGLGQRNPIGFHSHDDAGNDYIYMPGVASLAQGDFVFLNFTAPNTGATVRVLNDANTGGAGLVGMAMAAIVANCFGWFQVYGLTPAFANIATASFTLPAALYRSGTTARLSTSAVAKDSVFGAYLAAASVSNVGQAILNYPHVQDQSTL